MKLFMNTFLEYTLFLNNIKQWSNNDPLFEEKRYLRGLSQARYDRRKRTFYLVNLTESTRSNKFLAMLLGSFSSMKINYHLDVNLGLTLM